MVVRVVTLTCKAGAEEKFRRVGREILVPINKAAGCINVYFLEPSVEDHNLSFGVVSIWESKEQLIEMKRSKSYNDLLAKLTPLTESVVDKIYLTH